MPAIGVHPEQKEAAPRETALRERPSSEQTRLTEEVIAGGSASEALAGAAAVVLAIIGLSVTGTLALYLAAVSTIAIGFALLVHGAAISSRHTNLLRQIAGPDERVELEAGMSSEFLGGGAGIVLGILALLQIIPYVLIPVAAIVFGGSLLVGGGATSALEDVGTGGMERQQVARHKALSSSVGAQVFIGIGAAILGILVLAGSGNAMILSLVAMLALGAAMLLSGTSLGGRMMRMLVH